MMLRFCRVFLIIVLCCLTLPGCAFIDLYRGVAAPSEKIPKLYRGVFHVHSRHSHDSKATLQDIIKTAQKSKLDFVVITDHNTLAGQDEYQTLKREYSPLLVFGNEISSPDGHLIALGISADPPKNFTTQKLIDWIHAQGGYAILAHPVEGKKPWSGWSIPNWDGMEIYNFSEQFYQSNKLALGFKMVFLPPSFFLKSISTVSEITLQEWRSVLAERMVSAFGASNAHVHVRLLGWNAENLRLYFDAVTQYVWVDEKNPEAIIKSLGQGRGFLAFEALGSAQNVLLNAEKGGRKYLPGDFFKLKGGALLNVQAVSASRILVFRNGKLWAEAKGEFLKEALSEPGRYHAEIYKKDKIWVVTNAVNVQAG